MLQRWAIAKKHDITDVPEIDTIVARVKKMENYVACQHTNTGITP